MTEPLNLDVKAIWIQDVIGDAEALAVKDTSLSSAADLEDVDLDPTSDVTLGNLSPEATLSA